MGALPSVLSDVLAPEVGNERKVGWPIVGGTLAAVVIVFGVVTLGMGLVAGSFALGAALGAFCAAFGGVGFGVMLGGALAILGNE